MNVSICSFIFQGYETIFVTSHCGKFAVDIDVLEDDTYHCQPVDCYSSVAKIFFNRKEAITFAENWCSIT